MRQLGQVEVLAKVPWYQSENFWMGLTSSLLATAIFWYFIHDLLPIFKKTNEDEEAE